MAQRYELVAARGRSQLDLDVQPRVVAVLDQLAVKEGIENLLSNALKFGIGMPMTLRLRSSGQSVQLDVQDHGIGMSADQRARLFGRFEQVVASTGASASASAYGWRTAWSRPWGRHHRLQPPGPGLDLHRGASPCTSRARSDDA